MQFGGSIVPTSGDGSQSSYSDHMPSPSPSPRKFGGGMSDAGSEPRSEGNVQVTPQPKSSNKMIQDFCELHGVGKWKHPNLFNKLPEGKTIYDRFSGFEGVLLFEICESVYKVGQDMTFEFYSPDGAQLLVDHELNQREEESSVEEYIVKICKFGNAVHSRGIPLAQLSQHNKPPYKMLSYRQLSKAVYKAHQREPDNPLVKHSIEKGIPRGKAYDCDTPPDVIEWLVGWDNIFHGGSKTSYVQVVNRVPGWLAAWTVHSYKHGIFVSSSGKGDESYEAKRWKWMKEKVDLIIDGTVPSQNCWLTIKALYNALDRTRLLADFNKVAKLVTNFHEARLAADIVPVVSNLQRFLVNIAKTHLSPEDQRILFFSGFCYIVPMRRFSGVSDPRLASLPISGMPVRNWLFDKFRPDLLDWLLADMSFSVLYQDANNAKKAKVIKPALPKSKASKKKDKDKENAAPKVPKEAMSATVVVRETADKEDTTPEKQKLIERGKFYVEDFFGSLNSLYDAWSKEGSPEYRPIEDESRISNKIVNCHFALEYLWFKDCQLPEVDKCVSKYSVLRCTCQAMTAEVHDPTPVQDNDEEDKGTAASIRRALKKVSAVIKNDDAAVKSPAREFLDNEMHVELVSSLQQFVESGVCNGDGFRQTDMYKALVQALWPDMGKLLIQSQGTAPALQDVLTTMGAHVWSAIPAKYVTAARCSLSLMRAFQLLPPSISAIFVDAPAAMSFLKLRSRILAALLDEFCGPQSVLGGIAGVSAQGQTYKPRILPADPIAFSDITWQFDMLLDASCQQWVNIWTSYLRQGHEKGSGNTSPGSNESNREWTSAFIAESNLVEPLGTQRALQQPSPSESTGSEAATATQTESTQEKKKGSSLVPFSELNSFCNESAALRVPVPDEVVTFLDFKQWHVPKVPVQMGSAMYRERVCMFVQQTIWDASCTYAEDEYSWFRCDILSPEGTCKASELSPEHELMMMGPVSMDRAPNAWLAAVLQLQITEDECREIGFYIRPDLANKIGSRVPVPGWLMPEASPEQQSLFKTGFKVIHSKLPKQLRVHGNDDDQDITIVIPYLSPKEEALNWKQELPLFRDPMPTTLLVEPPKKSSGGTGKARGGRGGNVVKMPDNVVDFLGSQACVKELTAKPKVNGTEAADSDDETKAAKPKKGKGGAEMPKHVWK